MPAPRRSADSRSAPIQELDPSTAHTVPLARTGATRAAFRPDIEGLRAVAVGSVVLAHAGVALSGGYVGVDVFFVISGFLLTRQLTDELRREGRIDVAGFYARRLRRIVPAAALVIATTLLASWRWLSPLRAPALAQDAVSAAVSVVNWRFAAQDGPGAVPSPFEHFWSMSVGEQFFAVWPLLLVVAALPLGRRLGRERTVVAVLLAVIAGSFAWSVTVTATSPAWAYFGTPTRVWELGAGALVAVTAGTWERIPRWLAAAVSWVGLGLVAYAAVAFTVGPADPGSLAAVPVGGAALLIVGGGAPRLGAQLLLARAPMQWLGRLSYPLYLWHWPVLLLLPAALGRPADDPDAVLVAVVAIGISVALAAATRHVIEQPLHRCTGLVRHPERGILVAGGLLAAAVAVAVALFVAVPGAAATPTPVVAATHATPGAVTVRPRLVGAVPHRCVRGPTRTAGGPTTVPTTSCRLRRPLGP